MAVEYELKYRATPEILEQIQADFPGEYTVTEMTTTYYDTPGGPSPQHSRPAPRLPPAHLPHRPQHHRLRCVFHHTYHCLSQ